MTVDAAAATVATATGARAATGRGGGSGAGGAAAGGGGTTRSVTTTTRTTDNQRQTEHAIFNNNMHHIQNRLYQDADNNFNDLDTSRAQKQQLSSVNNQNFSQASRKYENCNNIVNSKVFVGNFRYISKQTDADNRQLRIRRPRRDRTRYGGCCSNNTQRNTDKIDENTKNVACCNVFYPAFKKPPDLQENNISEKIHQNNQPVNVEISLRLDIPSVLSTLSSLSNINLFDQKLIADGKILFSHRFLDEVYNFFRFFFPPLVYCTS